MKILLFVIFVFPVQIMAQLPELLFVKSLGVDGSNADIQSAFSVDLDTIGRVYTILSGASIFDVGLLENQELISSPSNQASALIRFSNDQFDLGGFGFTALSNMNCDSSGVMIFGTANSNSNFNFSTSPSPIFNELQTESQNFLCRYNFEGFPLWINLCQQTIRDAVLTSNEVICGITNCTNCEFIDGLGLTYNFEGTTSDAVMVSIDASSGELLSSKSIISDEVVSFYDIDFNSDLQEFSCSFELQGEVNFQWLGAVPFSASASGKEGLVVTYNSILECTSVIITEPIGFEPEFNRCRNLAYDATGNLYGLFMMSEGNYNVSISDNAYPISINSPLAYVILKVDHLKRLCWVEILNTNGFSGTRNLYSDADGFVYLSGAYNSQLIAEEDNLTLNSAFTPEAGFLASFTPEGSILWLHSLSAESNSTVYDLVVNDEREMYTVGRFTAFGVDFDFDPNMTVNLGPSNNYDPFIAKYQLPEITPDLFVSKRYEGVGVSEDGQADLIRLRLSRVPESSVTVELTPDAQLNLGNGVGVPLILEFAADQSAILEQVVNIDALNDLVVEGLHTGLISISMTSADAAFNNLSENPISVSIIDNDVMSVEERNEFGFSMSPNPASNFIDISCSQKPEGISLVEIIDIQGKKVYSQNFVSNTARIDLSQFSKGTYSVLVRAEDRVIWREGLIVK